MQNQIETSKLELTDRKKLNLTGVDNVEGFSEQYLNLVVGGIKTKIVGKNIKITSYNKTTGNLCADGDFSEIKYSGTKTPLVKKIFK